MCRKTILTLLFFVIVGLGAQEYYDVDEYGIESSYNVKTKNLLKAKVLRVIDARTIFVEYEVGERGRVAREIVKLIGIEIDSELMRERRNGNNGLKIQSANEREAESLTKAALEEKEIYLAFDRIKNDREGNMLVYVYFSDGNCYNTMMIRQGYARVSIWYPFAFEKEYLKWEEEAKGRRYGIWR
jgi:micrococcal nuclease